MLELLGTNKMPGSSVKIGVPYQELPGVKDGHRNNSVLRANRICELVDVKNKTLLDLGCNVGTMSKKFYDSGARVTGVDYDGKSLDVAVKYNAGPEYILGDIDFNFIKNLGHYDVIVWISQFMWLVHQRGIEEALRCLWEIGRHCDTLIFETSGKEDGSAPLPYSQEDILGLLCQNTIFNRIKDHGQWNDQWTPRNVFVCSRPVVSRSGLFSNVQTAAPGTIIKTFDGYEYWKEIKKRTSEFMRVLGDHPNFPRLISEASDSITMTWEGPQASFISANDFCDILNQLRTHRITHRDIRPDNLLFNGRNVVLIDPSMAVYDGELANTSCDLGGEFKCPHGFNDEYSLQKSMNWMIANV